MPETYAYKVRDKTGKIVSGTLIADNEAPGAPAAPRDGLTPLEVGEAERGLKMELNLRPKKVKLKDLAVFSRQFATMVNSGLPILRALAILADQTENKELASVLDEVRLDVEQGASLSTAMAKHPKVFNDLYISMVRSGETGGSLDDVLLRLADLIEKEVELRGKIKSAMTYPIAVVVLVVLIMTAMLLFIVPQFKGIYRAARREPAAADPHAAGRLRRLPEVLVHRRRRRLRRLGSSSGGGSARPAGREAIDRIKLKVPVFGSLFHKTALSRFSSTLGDADALGRPDPAGARHRDDTVNNKVIVEGGDRRAGERPRRRVDRQAARQARGVPAHGRADAGRGRGDRCGRHDAREGRDILRPGGEATVDALTSLIEPLLIAVIGGLVGAAVIALYMPMFNIIKLIK